MLIKLYKHNATAYQNAVSMLHKKKKAAVIHPTGTGKSFIAFKLCEDNPQKNICWLSPSEYIFSTQLENLKKSTGGYEPKNIGFYTYAKLMNMTEKEIAQMKPDYIILDEFHRCGAQMWGLGVQTLFRLYPDIPVLGLSATAIRYLDNQRDMSDELFDGNIASEMTLGEAIVKGILSPPKYVLSVFSYHHSLQKYENKLKKVKNNAVYDEGKKYLDALRRALEQADGLDEIFYKHMPDRRGKYIVFCSNYDHMKEMEEKASEWFCKVDPQPRIYSLYSENPASNNEFQAFKDDNDRTHLRLLYCIDALNEGVHADDISGVILLRPTVSPIIYKQQIGRAMSAGNKNNSVIFDIVLNIENLCSIGTIEEEMQLAVSYYRLHERKNEIANEHFQVTDEVNDCIALFDKLNDTLIASWDYMYAEARKYYLKNGNLEIPKRFKTDEGYSLGSWLITQRRVFAGHINGTLTKERIAKLNKIGMNWENRRDGLWNKYFKAAKKYYSTHKNLNVPSLYTSDDGVLLGAWISRLRTARKNGFDSRFLTEERIKALNELGMIWEVSDFLWQQYYGACLTYHGTNGHLDVPGNYVTGDGLRLGNWIRTIRRAHSSNADANENGKLSKEQTAALDELGMIWSKKQDHLWDEGLAEAKRYRASNGNLEVPTMYKTPEGYALGKWLERQRQNPHLSDFRKEKLERLGMVWEKADSWELRFTLAKEYFEKNGNLDIKADYATNGIWLGKWLYAQREQKRKGVLPDSKAERLNAIGMDWLSPAARRWETYFKACEKYYRTHGNLNINTVYQDENGLRIGRWLKKMAGNKPKLETAGENGNQIMRLESIGMKWAEKKPVSPFHYELKSHAV